MLTAKDNLPFKLVIGTKLFTKMFPDSVIAKQFACSRTKCTAIVREALAPYCNDKIVSSMSNPFSIDG